MNFLLSHLDGASSSVIGGKRNNYSNNHILSSQFQVYFIFKLVPFLPESLPLSVTGCSSLARASCAARVRLDHTLSRLLIKEAGMRKFGTTRLRQLLEVKLTATFRLQ